MREERTLPSLTRRVTTKTTRVATSPQAKVLGDLGARSAIIGGFVAEIHGGAIHSAATVDGGVALVTAGAGAIFTAGARPAPSPGNRLGIKSRALRRVMIGAGTAGMAAGYAIEAAGAHGAGPAIAIGAGAVASLGGLISGL